MKALNAEYAKLDPYELTEEAFRLLDLVNMEFQTDPHSVQCFDLRVVSEIKDLCAEYRRRLDACPFR